jgi:hypothetical protein
LATSALHAIWPGRVGVAQACRTGPLARAGRGVAANRAEDDTPAAGAGPGLSAAAAGVTETPLAADAAPGAASPAAVTASAATPASAAARLAGRVTSRTAFLKRISKVLNRPSGW